MFWLFFFMSYKKIKAKINHLWYIVMLFNQLKFNKWRSWIGHLPKWLRTEFCFCLHWPPQILIDLITMLHLLWKCIFNPVLAYSITYLTNLTRLTTISHKPKNMHWLMIPQQISMWGLLWDTGTYWEKWNFKTHLSLTRWWTKGLLRALLLSLWGPHPLTKYIPASSADEECCAPHHQDTSNVVGEKPTHK